MAATSILALGNAGVAVLHDTARLLFDPLPQRFGGVAAPEPVDLILITHDHWDHWDPDTVVLTARHSGARVVGPQPVIRRLHGRLPDSALVPLEPNGPGATASVRLGSAEVTAFRTAHGAAHNSYLVALPSLRLFHDGDNEQTGLVDRARLTGLDVLMLCPWQGSGWPELVRALQPRYWLLIHLDADELEQHARGKFLPALCREVPMPAVGLRPGERLVV